jgi:hypothetical protein
LRHTCAPYCASSDLDSAKREALVADVSLGVGVVSLGAAAYFLLARPSTAAEGDAKTGIVILPTRGGGVAGVHGAF